MRNLTTITALFAVMLPAFTANAYLSQILTYSNLFERADLVVIATPIESKDSSVPLKIEAEQPKDVMDLIKTVSTKFKVALVLKGRVAGETFQFLHLNRRDKHAAMMFGDIGTFFIDFDTEHNKNQSFILFIMKREDGAFCPAWRPMEGSRAIIPIKKDETL